jgi:hypothetical protein
MHVAPDVRRSVDAVRVGFGPLRAVNWRELMPLVDDECCVLLDGLLTFDPSQRMTVDDVLRVLHSQELPESPNPLHMWA